MIAYWGVIKVWGKVMCLHYSADLLLLSPANSTLHFEEKGSGKRKIVIKRPVIFISIEGKKRNPTGLN